MRLLRPVSASFLFAMCATLFLLGGLTASWWPTGVGVVVGLAGFRWLRKTSSASSARTAPPAPQIPGPTMDEIHAAEEAGRIGSAWVVDSEVRNEFANTGKYELLSHVIVKLLDQPEYQTIIREFGYPAHHGREKDTVLPVVQLAEGAPEVAVRDGFLDPDTSRAEFGYPRFWTSRYDDAAFDAASLSGSVLPLIPREPFVESSLSVTERSPMARYAGIVAACVLAAVVGVVAGGGVAREQSETVLTALEAQSNGTDDLTRNGELLQARVNNWAERTGATQVCGLSITPRTVVVRDQTDGSSRLAYDLRTSTVTNMSVHSKVDELERCESVDTDLSAIDLDIVPVLVEQSTRRHSAAITRSHGDGDGVRVYLDLQDAPRNSYEAYQLRRDGNMRPAYWVVAVDAPAGHYDTYALDGTYLRDDPLRLND